MQCLYLLCHWSPILTGSFAERDLQLTGSFAERDLQLTYNLGHPMHLCHPAHQQTDFQIRCFVLKYEFVEEHKGDPNAIGCIYCVNRAV